MPELAIRCDVQLLADELRDILRFEECEAQRRGAHYFYSFELMAAMNAFLQEPSEAAARHLQDVAPVLTPLFKACSRGGHLHEFRKMLAS